MENYEEEGVIKKAEKKLYSIEPGNLERKRSPLSNFRQEEKGSWAGEINVENEMKYPNKKSFSFLTIMLIFSFLFFVGAVGFAYYLFSGGVNTISPDNVSVSIVGPVSVKGGEEFNLQITITNNNNISLEYVDLIATFPGGSKISSVGSTGSQFRKNLGTINPNQVINETIKGTLFGEEKAERDIYVTLEYRNKGSNAIIEKEELFKTTISSSPLSLFFDIPKDANSNQEIVLNAKLTSNSKETLKDVLLNLSYPSGFIFKSANPTPTSGDGVWEFGDMKQGTEKKVKITGVIQGQNNEDKTFRASAGTRTNKDSNRVEVPFASSLKTIAIKNPFIGVNLVLNGSSADTYVSTDGQSIRGDIEWTNNLPVKLLHSEITVSVNGEIFNKSSVLANNGFFRSGDNTLLWNQSTGGIPDSIEPGQDGRVSFSFSPFSLLSGKQTIFKNPELDIAIRFRGVRFSEEREEGSFIETTMKRKIKMTSNLQVAPRALYFAGPFKNTGPLPPVHDNETTYTIIWSLVNSSNDVSGVKVKTTIPPYGKWLGVISPTNEKVTYNPLGGEIIWDVGSVKAGSGVNIPAKEVAFQVSITPSLSQVGTYPILINDSIVSGVDDFTGATINYSRRSISSKITADPAVRDELATGVK